MIKQSRLIDSAFLTGTISRITRLALSAGIIGQLLLSTAVAQEAEIQWWDIFLPLEPLHEEMWEAYTAEHPDVQIEYALQNDPGMGQALQLAFRSGQAPDVHSLSGLGVPVRALYEEGWFTSLEPHVTQDTGILKDALFEGITVFGGEVYSFPIFSTRWHIGSNWFNKELMEETGFDPEVGPTTWDEMLAAAREITESGEGRTYGLIMPLQFTDRMSALLIDLAETAGAPGIFDPKTGAYLYDSEPFVQALEFLLQFQEEGTLHPASLSLDSRQARTRWAAGEAGMFFDGPWMAGVLSSSYPEVMNSTGVAPIPVPDDDVPAFTYSGPPVGTWFVSSQSENPDIAADILEMFTTQEYYVQLAERMDQPPLDLSAVEQADVHPIYRQALRNFQDSVRIGPDPVVGNPNVAQVNAEMRDISPDLGEIIQGAFSGALDDPRQALSEFNNKMTAERERAIQVVQNRGLEVSLDDWVFPNWQPGEDYTPEKYQ